MKKCSSLKFSLSCSMLPLLSHTCADTHLTALRFRWRWQRRLGERWFGERRLGDLPFDFRNLAQQRAAAQALS